jgi:hypothetical protein
VLVTLESTEGEGSTACRGIVLLGGEGALTPFLFPCRTSSALPCSGSHTCPMGEGREELERSSS